MTTTIASLPPKPAAPIDKPIRSKAAYVEAVKQLDQLIDLNPREGTSEYDRMELLAILIGAYEVAHIPPIENASPPEIVQFMADQNKVSSSELAELMGGRSRLSDFYHERRPLSKAQIIKLRDKFGIPADLLI